MYRVKRFSIQEGRYTGGKRSTRSGGYVGSAIIGGLAGGLLGGIANAGEAGSLIGAGFSAFVNWMINEADKSEFNRGRSTRANSYDLIKVLEFRYNPQSPDEESTSVTTTDEYGNVVTKTTKNIRKDGRSAEGIAYDVDGDPKRYIASILYRGNVEMIYLNKPSFQELNYLNRVLDSYCQSYKNADYNSSPVGKNEWVIEVNTVSGTESIIPISMIDSGMKINILTGNKLGRKGFSNLN